MDRAGPSRGGSNRGGAGGQKRGGFRPPWLNRGGGNFVKQTEKPLFTLSNITDEDSDDDRRPTGDIRPTTAEASFTTGQDPDVFKGWKLYFPTKGYNESTDLIKKIKTMEKHFTTHKSLYNRDDIVELSILPLPLDNLREDPAIEHDWPKIFEDLLIKPTETLACMALAMHNIICSEEEGTLETFQHPKIFTRPIGSLNNPVKIKTAHQSNGELITVIGTVVRMDAPKITTKMVCYRCRQCYTELVVKQNDQTAGYVHPSSCRKGCPARSKFVQLLSSPFTMVQPKQMIRLQEDLFVENQEFKDLDVELIQDLVNKPTLGCTVSVTGVIKHGISKKNQKFQKKTDAKLFKSYLKCFNLEIIDTETPSKDLMTVDEQEIIQIAKSQPSPFRLLLHSLCPMIYGREEVKAGLILALLSGSNLSSKIRSESHLLMIGNPGVGKSKLLQACAEVSIKGTFVSGPTTTGVGLTASVGKNGVMEAGSLILANGGACCIDEFDKMSSHAHILLESMEQQIISITKCGSRVNLPSNVVILAAANPIGSFYDKTKTLRENVKISTPLLSRFDLIYQMGDQDKATDLQYMAHIRNQSGSAASSSRTFFTPQKQGPPVNKDKLSWLKLQQGEKLDLMPPPILKLYIAHAREHCVPTIKHEAKEKILEFFMNLRKITAGNENITVTYRQLEGLIRLSLARARADLNEFVTLEHVTDAINLVKFTMIDVFGDETVDLVDSSFKKKSQTQNLSSMSKPKQQKAFIDHLRDLEIEEHTTAGLKEIAKELGIKDFYEILDKLNFAGDLLKIPNGYRVVDA